MVSEGVCGSEPPDFIRDDEGRVWHSGDCRCTLPPQHDGRCVCEPCRQRTGAPGWEAEA